MAGHEHEAWQILDNGDGGTFCGACGDRVTAGEAETADRGTITPENALPLAPAPRGTSTSKREKRWLVTFTKQVEAETPEEAYERADDGKGGGHWEATLLGPDAAAGPPEQSAREQYEDALKRFREADDELQEHAVRYAALCARQADSTATYLVLDTGDSIVLASQMTLVDVVDDEGLTVPVPDNVTDDINAAATALTVDGAWTRYAEEPDGTPPLGRQWVSIDNVLDAASP